MIAFLIVLFCISSLVFLINKKINALFAFCIVSVLMALLLKIPLEKIPAIIQKGLGDIIGSIALIIILGACIGRLIAVSGAVDVLSTYLIKKFGQKNVQICLMIIGFIVGIPLFYSVGFFLLIPFVFSLNKQVKLSSVSLALPMLASLSTAHGFLPPHPSPVTIIAQFKANLLLTLGIGICIAIPCVLIGGLWFSKFLNNIQSPTVLEGNVENKDINNTAILPSFKNSIISCLISIIIVFIICMLNILLKYYNLPTNINQSLKNILNFISQPLILQFIALIFVSYSLGIKLKKNISFIMNEYEKAIKEVAIIIFIMGGAGIFKEVLLAANLDKSIISLSQYLSINILLFGWIMAAIIRLLIGSATIAGITTATLLVPLIPFQTELTICLLVLAIGAGSLFGSHVNDPAFWLFKEYFKLTIKQTLKTWTVMESIISIVGIICILIIHFFTKN